VVPPPAITVRVCLLQSSSSLIWLIDDLATEPDNIDPNVSPIVYDGSVYHNFAILAAFADAIIGEHRIDADVFPTLLRTNIISFTLLDGEQIEDVSATNLGFIDEQVSSFFDATLDLQVEMCVYSTQFQEFITELVCSPDCLSVHHLRAIIVLFSFSCFFQFQYLQAIVHHF
jgi:hypothetical protein